MSVTKETQCNTEQFAKRWLCPEDLEQEFGIGRSCQAKMRMSRTIPFSKIGGKFIRYDRLQIDKWLENNQVVSVA